MKVTSNWIIDGSIDLTGICERSGWGLYVSIDALKEVGLPHDDATAFARFAFADKAEIRDPGTTPEDELTDAQYARLALGAPINIGMTRP